MKTEYNIKDTVWIHMGERKLTKGRVVEIIDLEHLNENYDPDYELYVIEVQTGIDPVYEVRDFGQISPDSKGPIALFRREGLEGANRFLRKVGLPLPQFEEWTESNSAPKELDIKGWQPKPGNEGSPNPPNQGSGASPKKKKYYYRKKPKKASA